MFVRSENDSARLTSFYQNPTDYEQAFLTAQEYTPSTVPVYAAITSHHFLAKTLIARTMTGIDPTNIKNIVVISPDHFQSVSDKSVLGVTTLAGWDTPYGQLDMNPGQVEALTTLGSIKLQSSVFLNEHGIYTLIPFIKKQFPNASVVPIVLRSSDDYAAYQELGKSLKQFYNPSETLIIVSSDFSHSKSIAEASSADSNSINALERHTLADVQNIDSDCKVCMATLFGYLDTLSTQFQFVENKNSYDYSGESPDSVTSYVSGYYMPQQPENRTQVPLLPQPQPTTPQTQNSNQNNQNVKLLFGGDLMFDRTIRQKMQLSGNDFVLQELKSLFSQQTAVIANLEGPITSNPSKSVGSAVGSSANFIFTFDPSVAKLLYDTGLQIVNLGNNHIRNFGEDGVVQTKQYLNAAQVQFFGDTGSEQESNDRILIMERAGLKIGLVSYNQFTTDGMAHALTDIQAVRPNVDLVILYTHWGNEYVPTANEVIQNQAHRFIDEGVDLIIGSHPHVIQNVEEYKGKRIYYSLGNFVFDQYFSPETQQGMLVEVVVNTATKGMAFNTYTVRLKPNGQTILETPAP